MLDYGIKAQCDVLKLKLEQKKTTPKCGGEFENFEFVVTN